MTYVLQEHRAIHSQLTWHEKIILTLLANNMTADNMCEITTRQIASITNIAKSTVNDILKNMASRNLISKATRKGRKGGTRITLTLPPAITEAVLLETVKFHDALDLSEPRTNNLSENVREMSGICPKLDLTNSNGGDKIQALAASGGKVTGNQVTGNRSYIVSIYDTLQSTLGDKGNRESTFFEIFKAIQQFDAEDLDLFTQVAAEHGYVFTKQSPNGKNGQRPLSASPTLPLEGLETSRSAANHKQCAHHKCKAYVAADGDIIHDYCIYCMIRNSWLKHFANHPTGRPPKPALRSTGNRKLAKTRWKDPYFRENFDAALERASKSLFLRGESGKGRKWLGFNIKWFLKNNDNWENCLNGMYDNDPDEVSSIIMQAPNHQQMDEFGGF